MSPSDKKAADDAKKPDAAKKPAKKSAAKPAATKKAAASAGVPDSQPVEKKKSGFTGTLIVLLVAAAWCRFPRSSRRIPTSSPPR